MAAKRSGLSSARRMSHTSFRSKRALAPAGGLSPSAGSFT